MGTLWSRTDLPAWQHALASYGEVLVRQGVASLPERDRWYRQDLPSVIRARRPPHVTLAELVKITEWKMARGVWRAGNLILVKGNPPEAVRKTAVEALAQVPHPTAPIAALARLAGVGPATASAVVAACAPAEYPFLDELVAAQVPGLGKPAFTLKYYAGYAEALGERAARLGSGWTPAMVEQALWAHAGGKKGLDRGG